MTEPTIEDIKAFNRRTVQKMDGNEVIARAKEGRRVIYHVGFLPIDRNDASVGLVANEFSEMQTLGTVNLAQKKLAPYVYQYIAIPTEHGKNKAKLNARMEA